MSRALTIKRRSHFNQSLSTAFVIVACALLVVAIFIDVAIEEPSSKQEWVGHITIIWMLVFPTGVIATAFVQAPRDRRIRAAAEMVESIPCFGCSYSLAGLPRRCRCPECGQSNDTRRIRSFWTRYATPVWKWSRHWLKRLILVMLIGAAVFLVFMLALHAFKRPVIIYFFPGLVIFAAVAERSMQAFNRDLRQRLLASRFTLCRHCGYDLSHAGLAGACPSCGRQFVRSEIRKAWRNDWPIDPKTEGPD